MVAETDAAPGNFEKAHRDVSNRAVRVSRQSLENAKITKRESGDFVVFESVSRLLESRLLKRPSIGDLLVLQTKGEAEMQFGEAESCLDSARRRLAPTVFTRTLEKSVGAAGADGLEKDTHERWGSRKEDSEICILTRNPLLPASERIKAGAQRG